jgi:alpha-L-rhamnosidase
MIISPSTQQFCDTRHYLSQPDPCNDNPHFDTAVVGFDFCNSRKSPCAAISEPEKTPSEQKTAQFHNQRNLKHQKMIHRKLKKIAILLLVALFAATVAGCADSSRVIFGLSCELMNDPLGIDTKNPRLAWKIDGRKLAHGSRQTGYRILVATAPDKLVIGKTDVWDSGDVFSDMSQSVTCGGKLESSSFYYWRVTVTGTFPGGRAESDVARFSTGLFDRSDWHGQWIGNINVIPQKHLCFRKSFTLDQRAERASAHIASTGYHELYVNGKKADARVLAPAIARIDTRLLYVTYDIAPLLNAGANTVALRCAPGWTLNSFFSFMVGQALLVQVNGTTKTGDKFAIHSDESWKCAESNSYNSGKYDFMDMGGEFIDGRACLTDWNTTNFDDAAWSSAHLMTPINGGGEQVLSAQMTDPTVEVETIQAVSVTDTAGMWRVDMGKSFTGFLRASFHELREGDTVVIGVSNREHFSVEHNQTHYYVARGENGETFANNFNYFAGRYIFFSGLKRKPEPTDIIGRAISSAAPRTGTFSCSSELFNKIYELDRRTYEMCHTEGVVVDCPNRERLGYGTEGAYQTLWGVGLPCFFSGAYYVKNVRDWCDVQREDGSMNYVAPQISDMWGGTMSGTAPLNIAWEHYMAYGDERILETVLPTAKRWVEYLNAHIRDGMLTPFASGGKFLGEWVSPGPVFEKNDGDKELFFNNCAYVMTLDLYLRIVRALKASDADTARCIDMLQTARTKIHERYYNPSIGSYLSGDQVRSSFALFAGIVPDELRETVVGHLENDMTGAHPYIDIGSFTRYQFHHVLLDYPRLHNVFSTILSKTDYPGYGYFISKGETTLPEVWEIEHPHSAKIHTSYAGISGWFIKGLAGIEPMRAGYSTISIKPNVVQNLEHAHAAVETPFGAVESGWRKHGDAVIHEITVPTGTDAVIVLRASKVTAGGRPPEETAGVKSVSKLHDGTEIHVESGHYSFLVNY